MNKSLLYFSFLFVLSLSFFVFVFWGNENNQTSNGNRNINIKIEEADGVAGISSKLAESFAWSDAEKREFEEAWLNIKWDAFNHHLLEMFEDDLGWRKADRNIFLTHSSEFIRSEESILDNLYLPGDYEFILSLSPSEVAEELVLKVKESVAVGDDFWQSRVSQTSKNYVIKYIERQASLLPDIVLLPPRDIGIREEDGRILLVFSTTYYNQGDGALELIADPKTFGEQGDLEREVFQRIERVDGWHRDRSVGNFLWHEEHLHYHFGQFAEYSLQHISQGFTEGAPKLLRKETFCMRDITTVDLTGKSRSEAKYRICGKETQGVSVGWGDTYSQTYSGQKFDITEMPSGRYELSIIVNEDDYFEEMTKENNTSSAIFNINKDFKTVEILETKPAEYPEYKDVHPDQG